MYLLSSLCLTFKALFLLISVQILTNILTKIKGNGFYKGCLFLRGGGLGLDKSHKDRIFFYFSSISTSLILQESGVKM